MADNVLNACVHMAHLSLSPQLDEEQLTQAMHKIFSLVENDEECLTFIRGNSLEPGLELLAQKNDLLTNAMLARSHFVAGNWQLASTHADRIDSHSSADIVVMNKIARLMQLIEPVKDKEQFELELHQTAEWIAKEVATDLSNQIITLLAFHCPCLLMKAIEECANQTDNRDARLLLGYLNIGLSNKKDHIHNAFSYFVDAIK